MEEIQILRKEVRAGGNKIPIYLAASPRERSSLRLVNASSTAMPRFRARKPEDRRQHSAPTSGAPPRLVRHFEQHAQYVAPGSTLPDRKCMAGQDKYAIPSNTGRRYC